MSPIFDNFDPFLTLLKNNVQVVYEYQKVIFFSVEEGPPLSTKEVRLATVLREMPYVISFSQRVQLFQNLVARDKEDHQGDRVNFLQGKAIHVNIRRNYIYEDAFDKLSPENGNRFQRFLYLVLTKY